MIKPNSDYVGQSITVCHANGRIVKSNDRSYTVQVELGGVEQHVTVAPEYVHDQL